MRPAFAAAVLMLAAACSPADTAQAGGQNRGQSAAPMGETILLTPEARVPAQEAPGLKTAIFSGGCFWGIEAVFSHVKGVTSAVSGYQGAAPPPPITTASARVTPATPKACALPMIRR